MATWGEAVARATQRFTEAGLPSADVDARLLAEWVNTRRPELAALLTEGQVSQFEDAIVRRERHEPVQHIMGLMWFRYLELVSRPGVFIVRPETEMVTQAGIDTLAKISEPHPVVVDLCTGSGAIAISIATEVSRARVWAVEQDSNAYQLARVNNARYGSHVELVEGDARSALPELVGRVDVVITNPPYVPYSVELPADVLADPAVALYGGGDDGLDIPRQLVTRAYDLLKPSGVLIMEHSDEQGPALVDFAHRHGFVNGHTGCDLAGRDRWLYAEKEGM
ncbi:peptide chain release factor N(5)-glutamine methyltransferase [Arcanobacterium phocisimile]|uniref:peptide chain release factor N(5)-glutamine methyltransferase n=1 Tax=Arcanobacterium phocisimile TaxID=1302235 RepID=A0ABX7IIE0_9ACTO|nr:peptide chain release factor N(5)-glutamine methyltransferase [Arcanobacterium phocisimile]QRV02505.1 peptide chain release factor N(5)-glutamine methyltransferase [Arcanobacterium phocisimile]